MSVSVNVPEELYRRAAEVAAAENVSVDDLFASAFDARLLELERFKEKAVVAVTRSSSGLCRRFRRWNHPSTTAFDSWRDAEGDPSSCPCP